MIVAVFGTTISPYLFFWQASQEVEELNADPAAGALAHAPEGAAEHLQRIKIDTYLGMAFSNIVAFCIILGTAATLNAAGVTDIQTSAQAASALRPLAGDLSFMLFSLGIIGTGMIAVPVLAGSAAYAVAETFEWKRGLDLKLLEAREFYAIIALATLGGVALDFSPIDPIRALFWAAVINGIIAVPIMVVMMLLADDPKVMGAFTVTRRAQGAGVARDRHDGGGSRRDDRDLVTGARLGLIGRRRTSTVELSASSVDSQFPSIPMLRMGPSPGGSRR